MQIGNYPVNKEWKLDSVMGVAPMGSAVHTGTQSTSYFIVQGQKFGPFFVKVYLLSSSVIFQTCER